jgi:parallel beta-helix repeat protein
MKRLLFALALGLVVAVHAQGPLAPPGPPGPTMKTLDQVEPRIPITNIPTTISAAGSYYLVTNLTGTAGFDGVTIEVPDVMLDLNGFTLRGVPGSISGVKGLVDAERTTVRNGQISDWDDNGVTLSGVGCVVEGIVASTNGSAGIALQTGIIRDCLVTGNNRSSPGFAIASLAALVRCAAFNNKSRGLSGSTVHDCIARLNGAVGILGNQIERCSAESNSGDGIQANASGSIKNCWAYDNGTNGIAATRDTSIIGNHCSANGTATTNGAGIRVTLQDNRVEDNHLTDNDFGLLVLTNGNFIARNTASGNVTNYVIAASNSVGSITNVAGSTVNVANPWANFEF